MTSWSYELRCMASALGLGLLPPSCRGSDSPCDFCLPVFTLILTRIYTSVDVHTNIKAYENQTSP